MRVSGSNCVVFGMKKGLISEKIRAFGIHFLASVILAIAAAFLIFWLWYPNDLASYVGGAELYGLVLLVELGLGPIMSLVIYNSAKARAELLRDYAIVIVLQLAALSYGLYVVAESRPTYLIFVKDRFEVVTAIELSHDDYQSATDLEFRKATWFGPKRICVEYPTSAEERNRLLFSAIEGKDIQLYPEYYRHCKEGEVEGKAFAGKELKAIVGDRNLTAVSALLPESDFTWLPVTHRFGAWVEIYPEGEIDKAYFVRINPFS